MAGVARQPYVSGTGIWPLPDDAFQRTVASRDSFWTTLLRDDERFRVYLMNDRGGIYALGYPSLTWFGHLVNLAESLVVLTGALYAFLLTGAALFALSPRPRRPAAARCSVSFARASTASCSWRIVSRSHRAGRDSRVRRADVLRRPGRGRS